MHQICYELFHSIVKIFNNNNATYKKNKYNIVFCSSVKDLPDFSIQVAKNIKVKIFMCFSTISGTQSISLTLQ